MSQLDDLTEDYARRRVPAEKTVSGLRIALIIVGVAITLPAFLTGAIIGQQLGLARAALAFALGGLIVAVVGAMTGAVGARSGLPTGLIVKMAFGRQGAVLVNAVLLTTFFGWFGVTVALFAKAAGNAFVLMGWPWIPNVVLLLTGSIAMIAVTLFGFRALDRLSLFAVPLMLLFLVALVYRSLTGDPSVPDPSGNPDGHAVGLAASAVAGAFMVGATMMPDLCRYARSAGHAMLASLLAFGLGYPLVLLLAAVPAVATGETDMLNIIFAAGLGLPGLVMIGFASLTTNANNLYSSSLVLSALVRRVAKWKLVVVAGSLGSLFAALGIMDRLVDFLILLGVVVPPIAGIFTADHWLNHRSASPGTNETVDLSARLDAGPAIVAPAMVAWAAACAVGIATSAGALFVTGIPALDSMLTGFVVFAGLNAVVGRRSAGR